MGGLGGSGQVGLDGISKVSFKFLYTLWVYRTCIGLLIYMFKICHQLCLRMDGWMDGWMDGVSKVSFKFLYTLWVYSTCIYLLLYILKNCYQDPYRFQNFMSSWGSWSKISKLMQVRDFSFFGYKSSLLVSRVSFNYVYTFTVHR